jgi:hypothetical protein
MKKIAALLLGALLFSTAGVVLATTLKVAPSHMTVGMLQIFCKKDGKSDDRSALYGNGYCEGYLKGVIESYFRQVVAKRASAKRNACRLFPHNDWLRDELRGEILAISDPSTLSLEYGLPAKPWVASRLAAKCGLKK